MAEIHHILLEQGYGFTPSNRLPSNSLLYNKSSKYGFYTKKYTMSYGVFIVALKLPKDLYVELPSAFVIQMPQELEGQLIPHVSHEGYLCYVEQMEADWNPNNLRDLYVAIDQQIKITLDEATLSISNKIKADVALDNEFVSYWSGTGEQYLLNNIERKSSLITVFASTIDDKTCEFVTLSVDKNLKDPLNNAILIKWLEQRKLQVKNKETAIITTHYISVTPNKLTGVKWPPTSLRDVFSWLENVDLSARNQLVYRMALSNSKKNTILLDIANQDIISLYIEINLDSRSNRLPVNKNRRLSVRSMLPIVSSKNFCKHFKRITVTKADHTSIQSRNQIRGVDLCSKKIALIGCGTIGGYLAQLLIRNGAGFAKEPLHLFDSDSLKPHNFSRHTLSLSQFGENKALALATHLLDSIHIAKNIKGFSVNFPINEKSLSKYDIIIDATGRPPVSKRLAFILRRLHLNNKPVIIHAFNDGNGRASKVFIDNGTSCYGCMIVNKSIHQDQGDIRFKDLDFETGRKISCGNTYTIYDAAVSQITAAIALEAILNSLEENLPWTYSEFILDQYHRTGKRKILQQQERCSVCHE